MRIIICFTILFIGLCYSTQQSHHRTVGVTGNNNGNKFEKYSKSTLENATRLEFPWMVMIFARNHNQVKLCGGTLINSQIVLTAAHCVDGINHDGIQVRAGIWNSYETSNYQENRYVSDVSIHPQYSKYPPRNDYAILYLNRPIESTFNINYICIARKITINELLKAHNATCVMSGWGRVHHGRQYRNILKKIQVPLVDLNDCAHWYRTWRNNNICAGTPGQKFIGKGDDGGPLVCSDPLMPENQMLVGIYSYSVGNLPGVYMNVADDKTWIEDEMWTKKLRYQTECRI